MDQRKPTGGRNQVPSPTGGRDAYAAGQGSQGGVGISPVASRTADALQRARDQRPALGSLIHVASGSREQLDLFAWVGTREGADAGGRRSSAAAPDLAPVASVREQTERCPSCGAALGSGEDAHSMTGDALADHLLDYHEGELGAAECSYRRRKEQARALAQVLRRGVQA